MKLYLKPTFGIIRYTAMEAVRTRYSLLLLFLLLIGMGISMFSGQLAITETAAIQSTLTAAVLRLSSVLLLSLFVITSMVREFNDKTVEMMLSLPLPKAGYFLGKLGGYTLVAIVTAIPVGLLVFSLLPSPGALYWTTSLILELVLVAGISLMFSFNFTQVPAAFIATVAFYLLARSIAALQLMVHGPMVSHQLVSDEVLRHLVDGLAYLMPDLDRFTRSDWLVYLTDVQPEFSLLFGQTLIYLLLLASVALFDLHRKNF